MTRHRDLWRLRKGAKFTDTAPRMSTLVVGEPAPLRAKRDGLDLNDHANIIDDRACGYCGYLVCTPHCDSDEPADHDWPGGKKGDPAGGTIIDAEFPAVEIREMRRCVTSKGYECARCAWRSHEWDKGISADWFYAHVCSQWPEGTHSYQRLCHTHGMSAPYPDRDECHDAWWAIHQKCAGYERRGGLGSASMMHDVLAPYFDENPSGR